VDKAVAVVLGDGRVLINGNGDVLTDIYDPSSDSFIPTGEMKAIRMDETVTLLQDGRVLFAGGQNADTSLNSAELYDPAAGTFSFTAGHLATARAGATATLLKDGRVLIAGGFTNPLAAKPSLSTAEIFDPKTGEFRRTGSLKVARLGHAANMLPDGKVLITGGVDNSHNAVAVSELYDPVSGTFSVASSMMTARSDHTATTLSDGRVLIAGGDGPENETLASAELYDPQTGKFTRTGAMASHRDFDTATRLLDGRVLVVGFDQDTRGNTAEVYDPATGTFGPTGGLPPELLVDCAVLLPDGRVLVAVTGITGSTETSSTALYEP
jgi:hypothetical protein